MHPARGPRSPGPSRPPLSPTHRTLPPPSATSPPPQPPQQPSHLAQHTSLPPIRQLYLPHPPSAGANVHPPYPYSSGIPYQTPYPSQHVVPHPRETAELYGTADSEADDLEHHGPPKKKRRRQALSCTGVCVIATIALMPSESQLTSRYSSLINRNARYPNLIICRAGSCDTSRGVYILECKRRKIKCDRYVVIDCLAQVLIVYIQISAVCALYAPR
jgi:hypothetical protein